MQGNLVVCLKNCPDFDFATQVYFPESSDLTSMMISDWFVLKYEINQRMTNRNVLKCEILLILYILKCVLKMLMSKCPSCRQQSPNDKH